MCSNANNFGLGEVYLNNYYDTRSISPIRSAVHKGSVCSWVQYCGNGSCKQVWAELKVSLCGISFVVRLHATFTNIAPLVTMAVSIGLYVSCHDDDKYFLLSYTLCYNCNNIISFWPYLLMVFVFKKTLYKTILSIAIKFSWL